MIDQENMRQYWLWRLREHVNDMPRLCQGAEFKAQNKLFDKMVEFVKTIANHGACRGFSVDMVHCTDEARCNQCLSCEAHDIIDDIERTKK